MARVRPSERVDRRAAPKERGYDYRWTKLSESYRKANPFCAHCLLTNPLSTVLADDVDHIIPHNRNKRLLYSKANLQSLCRWHHRAKTIRDMQGLIVDWQPDPNTWVVSGKHGVGKAEWCRTHPQYQTTIVASLSAGHALARRLRASWLVISIDQADRDARLFAEWERKVS